MKILHGMSVCVIFVMMIVGLIGLPSIIRSSYGQNESTSNTTNNASSNTNNNTVMSSSPSSSQTNNNNSSTSTSLQSLTGIPYPNIPHENPDAVEHNKKFSPPTIVKVTDGVYSAIGYGMANIMMVEGTDGIIIIDTGETDEHAQKVLSEFHKITPKPVVAVIYTHNHGDHTEGAGVFVKDGEKAGKKVDMIGQESLVENYYKSMGALGPQRGAFAYRWSGTFLPEKGEDRTINAGIGPFLSTGNTSFIVPNVTFKDTLEKIFSALVHGK